MDSARIVDLPLNLPFSMSENLENGEELIDTRPPWLQGQTDFGVLDPANNNVLTAGSSFEFRVNSGDCYGTGEGLQEGDTVTIKTIHTPSNSIIINEEMAA